LDLSGEEIDDNGVQHIADALRNNIVRMIHYFSSDIDCLPFLKTLTSLKLGQNRIGEAGAQHLADALRGNTVGLFFFSFYIHILI
jgi:hypothetical protein